MSLEEAARLRKERLNSMKRKVTGDEANEIEQEDGQIAPAPTLPIFRNYTPEDASLKETQLERGVAELVENELSEQLEATRDTSVVDDIDLTKLAPRKIDWDLKRGCAKKLEKLERRTQRAIAELIRERVTSGVSDCLLVSAVNVSALTSQQGHASDDDDQY